MVAHASPSSANEKSPTLSGFQMYFDGLDNVGRSYDSFVKGMARAQLEMMGFFNRRAQATMHFPTRLANCRSAQDVAGAQLQYWRSAMDDYVESATRAGRAFGTVPGIVPAMAEAARTARDYITFPEPELEAGAEVAAPAAAAKVSETPRQQRKAA
ncbi:phasin family protein [Hyphomicrobium sulfonivorans]|uniref:Phasin domain-containing protein n=1 Tax=Hyphomicrobium sulfonivorans TaxID=121290 RepID=A0A109BDU0_HYPSL|nr:phasin family protein [Hyphomicrobium sulfonivorans]KWT66710.1 hypothetical protein APY04_2341 [Hyphomicrobium sulfonivorans]MBI1649404.1 phasin family protein [Hyphomicrobium sulfonivorans]NSL71321.1 hypothetical protein [Hyphomicrobium sulfonivorans]